MRRTLTSLLILALLLSSGSLPMVTAARQQATPVVDDTGSPSLPPPMAMPDGSPDEAAAILARHVLAGGETALPALLTGLQESGITVLHLSGGVAAAPFHPNQASGLAFFDWEVIAMLKLEQSGSATTFPELGSALSLIHPALANAPMADFLLDGIHANASSTSPALRFWARFVIALGFYGRSGYDLLGNADLTGVPLDGIQASLLMHRLMADLLTTLPATSVGTTPSIRAFAAQDGSKAPCQMGTVEGRILAGSGIAGSLGFGEFMGYLDQAGAISTTAAEKVARIAGAINATFAFSQLFFAMAAFHPEMSIEPPGGPLVRTKTREAGEQRTIRLKVSFDIGDWQLLNCIRPILQMAGIDLSQAVSQNGPLPGAEVAWTIDKGSVENVTDPDPSKHVLHPIIRFNSGDILRTVTDKDGIVRVVVEGVPQKEKLPGAYVPVPKEAKVRANVAMKSANLFDDTTTAISTLLCGGVIAAAGCAIPEMLLRAHILFNASISFQVIDWLPPGGLSIIYHTRVVSSTKGVGTDMTWEATLKLDPDKPDSGELIGTGTYYGTAVLFPANSIQCEESGGETVTLGGTVQASGGITPGWVTFSLVGTRTLGEFPGNVLGVPPDIAQIGAEQVDTEQGTATHEHSIVLAEGDKCYGTITQTDWVTIGFVPEDPASEQ